MQSQYYVARRRYCSTGQVSAWNHSVVNRSMRSVARRTFSNGSLDNCTAYSVVTVAATVRRTVVLTDPQAVVCAAPYRDLSAGEVCISGANTLVKACCITAFGVAASEEHGTGGSSLIQSLMCSHDLICVFSFATSIGIAPTTECKSDVSFSWLVGRLQSLQARRSKKRNLKSGTH